MTDERTAAASLAPATQGSAPPSLVELLREGVLDAELAALLWLLVGGGVPVIVAGAPGPAREWVMRAMLDLLPPGAVVAELAGEAEDFAWLPEAVELGWRPERPARRPERPARRPERPARRPRRPGAAPDTDRAKPSGPAVPLRPAAPSTVLVADLDDRGPAGTWGDRARIAIRALALGYDMAASIDARSLEHVLDRLASPLVGTDADERSRLGVVLVLGGAADTGGGAGVGASGGNRRGRVVAAHYVRPLVRDAHGHVQRLAPAVLAVQDARGGGFEHFAWGVLGELAARLGRRPAELEREQAVRAALLAGLAGTP